MKKVALVIFLLAMGFNRSHSQDGKIDCSNRLKSVIMEREMRYSVFLPNGYIESNRSYPVLYLLHGMWDNHEGWVQFGEVNRIASSLISKGEIPEMIIIMPDGLSDSYYINNYDHSVRWEDFFYTELIPDVEKKYRIIAKRNNRAIAGTSMGGYGALYHALIHKEMFEACYALSAAAMEITPLKKGEEQNEYDRNFQLKTWGSLNDEGLPQNYKKFSIYEIVSSKR